MASGKQIDEEQFVRNIGLAIILYKIISAIIIWLLLPSRIYSTIFHSLYAIVAAIFMIFGNSKARWFFVLGGVFVSIFGVRPPRSPSGTRRSCRRSEERWESLIHPGTRSIPCSPAWDAGSFLSQRSLIGPISNQLTGQRPVWA